MGGPHALRTARPEGEFEMWAWHAEDMGWGWWIAGPAMMLLSWGAVIWLVYSLFAAPRREPARQLTQREIAERRLASGEIDETEFDHVVQKIIHDRVQE